MTKEVKIFITQMALFALLLAIVTGLFASVTFEGVDFNVQCQNVPGGDVCNGTLYFWE